jgi:DNA repair exonuclease SbcCD nuclease subunit
VSENLAAKLVDGLEGGPGLHIALLHCNVGSDAHHDDYAPCSLEELKGSSFDAWLLGHVHERKVLCEAHPLVLYPGNIQGRSIREVGERGVTLICFDGDAAPTTEFIATSEVVWFEGETSIEGLDQVEDLIERIDGDFESLQESFPQAQSLVVRWHLTGRGDLHQVLAATGEDVIEALRSRARERQVPIWVEKLKFATQPALDLAELRQQAGFVSMVIECAEGEAAGDNEDNDSLTREELLERFAPLWSVSGIGGSLDKLKARIEDDPTAIRDLIDRAMLTAVSALTEGGE